MDIMVYLLNENKIPNRAWGFSNAFPVTWEVEDFKSDENEVAIEKIELRYISQQLLLHGSCQGK